MLRKESKLEFSKIFLRYFGEKDTEKFIRWNVYETDWKEWDAPWEKLQRNEKQIREFLLKVLNRPPQLIPGRLQICHSDGSYIGWVSTYLIDNCENKRAIGIDICDKKFWSQGLGTQALKLWIGYLFQVTDLEKLYCETWSGNTRMIRLAKKLDFIEIKREVNKRLVEGKKYDALRFELNRQKFLEANPEIINAIHRQLS